MENKLPQRKEIRLKHVNYSAPGAYFVTICTKERRNYFWDGTLDLQKFCWKSVGANCVRPRNLPLTVTGDIVVSELEKWHQTYEAVRIHSYVIMPNHLHIMVAILADEYGRPQVAPTLDRMVKQFKGAVTKKVGDAIWQKSFVDHIIRGREDFEIRSAYIYNNPLRWHFDALYSET